jgi:CheY-like chemotaxis protein
MSRILLADHSPHAQRMGERILRDEGYEVAAVTDGETALLRMKDLAPDLVLVDVSLPSRNGYEICEYIKTSGKYPKTRVVLTVGPLAVVDESRVSSTGSDGLVKKPFEASVLLSVIQPLLEGSAVPLQPKREPDQKPLPVAAAAPAPVIVQTVAKPRPVDREQIRAAVILALEAAMINIIENVTDKVVIALEADARMAASEPVAKAAAGSIRPAAGESSAPSRTESVTPGPGPKPEEPVVRVRTPVFRTLS